MNAALSIPVTSGSAGVRETNAVLLRDFLPALVGQREYESIASTPLRDGCDDEVVHAAVAPALLQQQMVQRAADSWRLLRDISDGEWYALWQRAGRLFLDLLDEVETKNNLNDYLSKASRTSGLPQARIRSSWRALARVLFRMDAILAAQSPTSHTSSYRDSFTDRGWMWVPRGRHIACRVPGNFPTINITWLQALAMRRPVLLCASLEEPFTTLLLAELLYDAGLPDGAISLCYGQAPFFWITADQVLWPGDMPAVVAERVQHVHTYHHGRSKVLILGEGCMTTLSRRLCHLISYGCGRLCTNASAILVEHDVEAAAAALAREMASIRVLPLQHPEASVPAVVDTARAQRILSTYEAGLQRGAIDVTRRITGLPLVVEKDGLKYMRPTVMHVSADDPLLHIELPFPFVTVACAPRNRMAELCKGSLIVSLFGSDRDLMETLIYDPTIDKVFCDEHADRGYDPIDPHEGHLADFLFRKKAVLPIPI